MALPRTVSGAVRTAGSGGLSLLELLVVLLVMSIMAALTVPMLSSTAANRLGWAACQVESDIIYAQTESMVHESDRRVLTFDTTHNRYSLATAAAPDTPLAHPVTGGPYTITFGDSNHPQLRGVSVSSYSLGGGSHLGFGLYGQLDQSTAATVTFAAGERHITVTIDASTGKVTIGHVR